MGLDGVVGKENINNDKLDLSQKYSFVGSVRIVVKVSHATYFTNLEKDKKNEEISEIGNVVKILGKTLLVLLEVSRDVAGTRLQGQ